MTISGLSLPTDRFQRAVCPGQETRRRPVPGTYRALVLSRATPPSEWNQQRPAEDLLPKAFGRRGKGKSRLETGHFVCFLRKRKASGWNLHTRNCRDVCFPCTHQTYLGTGSRADPGQRWRFKSNCCFKPYLSHQWFSSIQGENDFVQN